MGLWTAARDIVFNSGKVGKMWSFTRILEQKRQIDKYQKGLNLAFLDNSLSMLILNHKNTLLHFGHSCSYNRTIVNF